MTKTEKNIQVILHTVEHGRRRKHPLSLYLSISICSAYISKVSGEFIQSFYTQIRIKNLHFHEIRICFVKINWSLVCLFLSSLQKKYFYYFCQVYKKNVFKSSRIYLYLHNYWNVSYLIYLLYYFNDKLSFWRPITRTKTFACNIFTIFF